jgi:electron transport complex protein RnfC
MGLRTFKGGVHPFEGKELSKDKPVTKYLPTGNLVYPVSQHIGAPAQPVVAVGDAVKKGQLIAEAGGFVSANIYSSVSGTVKAIAPHRVATGDMVNSIVIENDGNYEEVAYETVEDPTTLSKEAIIEKVKKAGVVGMGGAGFPTHVKLSPKEPDKIDYIIANCAEFVQ